MSNENLRSLSDEELQRLADGEVDKMSEAALDAYNSGGFDQNDPYRKKNFAEGAEEVKQALKAKGWVNLSREERLALTGLSVIDKSIETLLGAKKSAPGMAMRSVPVAVGHKVGEMTRIPLMANALGAIGGAIGEYTANANEGRENTLGKTLGAAASGAIKPRSTGGGLAPTLKEAGRQGMENVAIDTASSAIDSGEIKAPSATAFTAGTIGGLIQGRMDSGHGAKATAIKKADEIQAYNTLAKSAEAGYNVTPRKALPTEFERATNAAVRRDLGLKETALINNRTLDMRLNELYEPYRKAASLSPEINQSLTGMIEARAESRRLFKAYKASNGNRPDLEADAETYRELADGFENDLIQQTRSLGKHGLAEEILKNRVLAAKTHIAMKAVNSARGTVDASVYGSIGMKNPKMLTGDAKLIADTYNANQDFTTQNFLVRHNKISMLFKAQ